MGRNKTIILSSLIFGIVVVGNVITLLEFPKISLFTISFFFTGAFLMNGIIEIVERF